MSHHILSQSFRTAIILLVLFVGAGTSGAQQQTTTAITVGPGRYASTDNPACGNLTADAVGRIILREVGSMASWPGGYAGPLADVFNNSGRPVPHSLLRTLGNADSSCGVLAVVLPPGAQYVGYTLQSRESWGMWQNCYPGNKCPVGWSQFEAEPILLQTAHGTVAYAIFKNWSHDRVRHASMTVFYDYWSQPQNGATFYPAPAQICVTPQGRCPLVAGFAIPVGGPCTCVFPGSWGPIAVAGTGRKEPSTR